MPHLEKALDILEAQDSPYSYGDLIALANEIYDAEYHAEMEKKFQEHLENRDIFEAVITAPIQ